MNPIQNTLKAQVEHLMMHHQNEPLQEMSLSSILSDSQSIQEDIFAGLENHMIQEYTDISHLNKKYMCLWNNWMDLKVIHNLQLNIKLVQRDMAKQLEVFQGDKVRLLILQEGSKKVRERFNLREMQKSSSSLKVIQIKYHSKQRKVRTRDDFVQFKPVLKQKVTSEQVGQFQLLVKSYAQNSRVEESSKEVFLKHCKTFKKKMKLSLSQQLRAFPQRNLNRTIINFASEHTEELIELIANFEVHLNILFTLGVINSRTIKQATAVVRLYRYQTTRQIKL